VSHFRNFQRRRERCSELLRPRVNCRGIARVRVSVINQTFRSLWFFAVCSLFFAWALWFLVSCHVALAFACVRSSLDRVALPSLVSLALASCRSGLFRVPAVPSCLCGVAQLASYRSRVCSYLCFAPAFAPACVVSLPLASCRKGFV
jgi:hypothetical protein